MAPRTPVECAALGEGDFEPLEARIAARAFKYYAVASIGAQ
jgi:hypothetical protein